MNDDEFDNDEFEFDEFDNDKFDNDAFDNDSFAFEFDNDALCIASVTNLFYGVEPPVKSFPSTNQIVSSSICFTNCLC